MKVAAIIQARTASKRYPNKVLETISNHPVLYHVIERIRDSQSIDVIIVATTTDPDDKILLKRAREFQVHSYAGSENDLMKRFLSSAELVGAEVIVRILCDNPLFEPSYIDDCLALLQKEKADYCYVEDAVPGTGVDIFTKEALKIAHEKAKDAHHREDIVSYFKDNPDKFKIATLRAHDRFKLPTLNLSFDTKEDLKLIRALYHKFYQEEMIVPLVKVITYLKQHPEIADLNVEAVQKAVEERELAAKAKAEAEAAAAAERTALRAKELAEKHAAKRDIDVTFIRPDMENSSLKKDIFAQEAKEEEHKEVTWEKLFKDDENKEEKEDLDLSSIIVPSEEEKDSEEQEETQDEGQEEKKEDSSGEEKEENGKED